MKKNKNNIGNMLVGILFIIVLVIALLAWLPFKLLFIPVEYIKYKRSRYQKDFPHKYRWLSTPHKDNEVYTIIKTNDLPIEYIKFHEDYDMPGYFLYKDILLNFEESLFFDKTKGLWLCDLEEFNADEEEEEYEEGEASEDDNTDDCLTVEGVKELCLGEFHRNISSRECNKLIFFYQGKHAEKDYGKDAVDIMRSLDGFIVYEKGELESAIKEFIDNN